MLSAPFASASGEYSDAAPAAVTSSSPPQVAQQSARSHHELALQDVFSVCDFIQLARREQLLASAQRNTGSKRKEKVFVFLLSCVVASCVRSCALRSLLHLRFSRSSIIISPKHPRYSEYLCDECAIYFCTY